MNVELANPSEIKSITKIYAEAFIGVGEDWTEDRAEKFVQFMFDHQSDMFFVAKDEGQIIGGIWGLVRPWVNGPHIVDIEIFVDPNHQGKRVSLHLYKTLLENAMKAHGVVEIEGMVDSKKDFPMNYYKSLDRKESGFVHIWGDASNVLRRVDQRLNDKK